MNGTLKKLLIGAVIMAFLGISSWGLSEVIALKTTIPSTYATIKDCKEVKSDVKTQIYDLKTDINRQIDNLKTDMNARQDRVEKKVDKILNHLINGD